MDQVLSKRLKSAGVSALDHVIVAIGPDGHAHVQGNVDLDGLKALSKKLIDLVDAAQHPPSYTVPVH